MKITIKISLLLFLAAPFVSHGAQALEDALFEQPSQKRKHAHEKESSSKKRNKVHFYDVGPSIDLEAITQEKVVQELELQERADKLAFEKNPDFASTLKEANKKWNIKEPKILVGSAREELMKKEDRSLKLKAISSVKMIDSVTKEQQQREHVQEFAAFEMFLNEGCIHGRDAWVCVLLKDYEHEIRFLIPFMVADLVQKGMLTHENIEEADFEIQFEAIKNHEKHMIVHPTILKHYLNFYLQARNIL